MVSYLPYSHFNLNNRLNFQLGNTLSEEKTFHLKKSGRMDHSFASSFPWLVASYLSVIKQRGYGGLFTFTKKDMTSQLTLPKWVIIYLTFYQRLIFQPVKLTQVYHFIFLFHKKKKKTCFLSLPKTNTQSAHFLCLFHSKCCFPWAANWQAHHPQLNLSPCGRSLWMNVLCDYNPLIHISLTSQCLLL